MAQGKPMPGEQYLHFKNRRYQVIAVAYHSETRERLVVYQALYGDFKTYVRPYDMFISEVDHEKYPDVKQKYRFQYLGGPSDEEWKEDTSDEVKNAAECRGIEGALADEPESVKIAECSSNDSTLKESGNGAETVGQEAVSEDANAGREKSSMEEMNAGGHDGEPAVQEQPEEGQLNPWLDKILDATSFDEKYKIVCDMQSDVTDKLIDDIAAVTDLVIPEGNLRERYAQLKYCLRTRQKYESGRLR